MSKIVSAESIVQRDNLLPNQEVQDAAAREEVQFIALLLKNKELLEDIITNSDIDHTYFFFEKNARLFALMYYYFVDLKTPLTEILIQDIFRKSKTSAQEKEFLDRLFKLKVVPEDFNRLKSNLIERNSQQCFYEQFLDTSQPDGGLFTKAITASSGQLKLLEEIQEKMLELGVSRNGDEDCVIRSMDEIGDPVIGLIKERQEDPSKHRGLMTGFRGIDDVLNGIKKGKYAIICGYPNGGKTTMMINLALGLMRGGARVCYVTIESSAEEIMERMLCNEAGVSSSILRKGGKGITTEIMTYLVRAKEKMKQKYGDKFVFITAPQDIPVNKLLSVIDRKRRNVGFDVVIVDYLDVVDSIERFPGRPDLELGQVSSMLQAYGKKQKMAMITAQSFNNETIKLIKKMVLKAKENGEETADDLGAALGPDSVGGSQKLSRDCDFMWGLLLGPLQKRMSVHWMKSRDSQKPSEPLVLNANLDQCRLSEATDITQESIEENSDDLLEAAFNRSETMKKAAQEDEEKMHKNIQKMFSDEGETKEMSSNSSSSSSSYFGGIKTAESGPSFA